MFELALMFFGFLMGAFQSPNWTWLSVGALVFLGVREVVKFLLD